MAISNYTELQDAVQSYVIYDDVTDTFDTLLFLAEAVLNRDIRIRQTQTTQAYASQSAQTITLPTDYSEAVTLYEDGEGGGTLEFVPPNLFWGSQDARSGSGQPSFYTVEDSTLTLAPAPDGARDYTLKYYATVSGLTASSPTNALLTAAPDVYLWQVLYQAALLADDQPSQAKYEKAYLTAKASLLDADKRARNRPGPRIRSRNTRDGARQYA